MFENRALRIFGPERASERETGCNRRPEKTE
jgi:hypothetical protein